MTAADLALLATPSIASAFFAAIVDHRERDTGHLLMLEALLGGDDLAQTLLLARSADLERGTRDQAAGAFEALLGCLDLLADAGRRLVVRDEQERFPLAVVALHATGVRRRAILRAIPPAHGAEALALLLEAGRAAAPHLQRAAPAAPPPPAPPPAAPTINVSLELPAGPLPVAIASTPALRAEQVVERDANDEIVKTVTTTTPMPTDAGLRTHA